MHLKSVVFVFLVAQIFCQTQAYNYCTEEAQKKLCNKRPHIVCNPEQIKPSLNLTAMFPITEKLIKAFVDEHNKLRQQMASGTEFCDGKKPNTKCSFPKAARMRELIWDEELAFIAGVHASRCRATHDKCRNTKNFGYSGQNLWAGSKTGDPRKALDMVEGCVGAWYSEKHKVKNGSNVRSFNKMEKGTGHLTVVVNDRVSRVGCAIAYCRDDKGKRVVHWNYVTCNYDYTNMSGSKVYTGDTESGSQCKDWGVGKSEKYEDLCANSGAIFKVY